MKSAVTSSVSPLNSIFLGYNAGNLSEMPLCHEIEQVSVHWESKHFKKLTFENFENLKSAHLEPFLIRMACALLITGQVRCIPQKFYFISQ